MAGGGSHQNCMTHLFFFFLFYSALTYDPEKLAESVEAFSAIIDICEAFANLFVNFSVLLSVLDPLVLCPFLLYCLSLAEKQPEAELAPAAEAECKALSCSSVKRMDGLIGSAHSPNFLIRAACQAPGAAVLHSSQKMYLFLCPSKCIPWWAQVTSNLITSQAKTKLAVCLLVTLQGTICCLTFYGQREPAGVPQRERDKPGWPMLGQEPRGQQQQDTGRKDDSQKKTVPSHAGLQLGGAQLPTTRPDRGDSLRWLRGDLWWNLSLTVSALLTRVIMDHRLRATTAVGNFSVVMGAVGLSLGTGRLHLPFPLAHTTLLSATEQQWNQLCLVKPSVCPEPTSCVWAEHSLIHCW